MVTEVVFLHIVIYLPSLWWHYGVQLKSRACCAQGCTNMNRKNGDILETLKKNLIKNVNTLSVFVHSELLVLVSCVAAAGWWLQWGIMSQAGCFCPSGGVSQPRDPVPSCSAGAGWAGSTAWMAAFPWALQGTAAAGALRSSPSLLLHNRSHHWILPFVFKGDFSL